MAKVRLEHGRVTAGQALPFDLADEQGRIWLKYGYVIQSQGQLDRLIERGVFFEEIIDETHRQQQEKKHISVFLRVSELAEDYGCLFGSEAVNYTEALNIAELIQALCELDGDAVLANIQLYKGGRYSLRHSFHAAVMTEMLLKRMDRPQEARCYAIAGALTMNICMLELQDVLYQQNIPLSLDQKRSIVAHPVMAVEALRVQGIEHPVWLNVVEHHHEMIDGSGYPKRVSKSELSIESQAVSLADRYCAMVSEREYRPGVQPNLVAQNLLIRQASTIDPALATAFTKEVGNYPPGTLVALANGEVAVVVRRLLNLDQPMVRSLRSPRGIGYDDPPKRVTSGPVFAIKEVLGANALKDIDWAVLWLTAQSDDGQGL